MTVALEKQIDRLAELANIGAGRAAGAFSQLTGHTIMMDAPRLRLAGLAIKADPDDPGHGQPGTADRGWKSGVIFEFDGCLDAIVAILFRWDMCDAVVRKLTGQAEGDLPDEMIESALMELGNVLASHVASAIADTLGARLLPSIPMLCLDSAFEQLEDLAQARGSAGELWIECELVDSDGGLGGLLVLVPEFRDHQAPHSCI